MRLKTLQLGMLGLVILFWYAMTAPGLIPPFYFDKPNTAAFFFSHVGLGRASQIFSSSYQPYWPPTIMATTAKRVMDPMMCWKPGAIMMNRRMRCAASAWRCAAVIRFRKSSAAAR